MTHLAAGELVQDGQAMQSKGHLQFKMLHMVVIVIPCPRSLPVFSGLERRQCESYSQHFRQHLTTGSS